MHSMSLTLLNVLSVCLKFVKFYADNDLLQLHERKTKLQMKANNSNKFSHCNEIYDLFIGFNLSILKRLLKTKIYYSESPKIL